MQYNRNYGDGPIGTYFNNGGHFPGLYHKRYFRQDQREAPPSIGELIYPRLNRPHLKLCALNNDFPDIV